jgi:phosphoribosylformylglycinamidine synthase
LSSIICAAQQRALLRKGFKQLSLRIGFTLLAFSVASAFVTMSATPAKSAVSSSKEVLHFYRAPGVLAHMAQAVLKAAQAALPAAGITALDTEHCFNVEVDKSTPLSTEQLATLTWLLAETYEAEKTARTSFLAAADNSSSSAAVVEVGPRLSFESAISSNAKSICRASGLSSISRVEVSRRWRVTCGESSAALSTADRATFVALVSDRMTETEYAEPLQSFVVHGAAEPVEVVPVLAKGRAALEDINARRGLGFDEWDLEFYLNLFR